MNRAELQQLAEDRILDAQSLLAARRWSAAYYLAGYAVECGLKSCILAHVLRTGVIFDDKDYGKKCWTHKVEDLVKHAGLQEALGVDISANLALGANWSRVKDWTEAGRYQQKSQAEAQELFDAINDSENGVLPWIKRHW